jgi:hypothetical protein
MINLNRGMDEPLSVIPLAAPRASIDLGPGDVMSYVPRARIYSEFDDVLDVLHGRQHAAADAENSASVM